MSKDLDEVKEFALSIRKHALQMTHQGGSSHIGSVLSCTDILASLYCKVLNLDPKNQNYADRDRFILSKGHAGAGVYAALAIKGFFDENDLKKHYKNGSFLSGHISHKNIKGVEFSTGSLGHGLGVAAGIAYAGKLNKKKYKTFVLLSDGECNEGSTWEAVMFANHFKLKNLVAIVDYNKLQSIKSTEETMKLEPFVDKWKAFGWNTIQVDGHNHQALIKILQKTSNKQPTCIIAHTIKGKGISFMEDNNLWHYRSPSKEDLELALREIDEN